MDLQIVEDQHKKPKYTINGNIEWMFDNGVVVSGKPNKTNLLTNVTLSIDGTAPKTQDWTTHKMNAICEGSVPHSLLAYISTFNANTTGAENVGGSAGKKRKPQNSDSIEEVGPKKACNHDGGGQKEALLNSFVHHAIALASAKKVELLQDENIDLAGIDHVLLLTLEIECQLLRNENVNQNELMEVLQFAEDSNFLRGVTTLEDASYRLNELRRVKENTLHVAKVGDTYDYDGTSKLKHFVGILEVSFIEMEISLLHAILFYLKESGKQSSKIIGDLKAELKVKDNDPLTDKNLDSYIYFKNTVKILEDQVHLSTIKEEIEQLDIEKALIKYDKMKEDLEQQLGWVGVDVASFSISDYLADLGLKLNSPQKFISDAEHEVEVNESEDADLGGMSMSVRDSAINFGRVVSRCTSMLMHGLYMGIVEPIVVAVRNSV